MIWEAENSFQKLSIISKFLSTGVEWRLANYGLFSMAHDLIIILIFLDDWGKIFHDMWKLHKIQNPESKTVLLEHSHVHSFMCHLLLMLCYDRVESCDGDCMVWSLKYLLSGLL